MSVVLKNAVRRALRAPGRSDHDRRRRHGKLDRRALVRAATLRPDVFHKRAYTDADVAESIRERIADDFIRLDIFYSSKTLTKVEEVPKYNFESLLSSYGGACPLYLGISFVALFELAELGIRFFLKCAFYRN